MRILAIDVGYGTSDILLWDEDVKGEGQVHMVVPSATQVVAREIREATLRMLPVVFRGPLMGGGPSTVAALRHLSEGLPFYADPRAARTFSDDLDEVTAMGVTMVDEAEAASLAAGRAAVIRSGDVRLDDLMAALYLLGEPSYPDGIAVAVQDHGNAPPGVSDRIFRFRIFAEAIERSDRLADLFFLPENVPEPLTRMKAAAACIDADVPVVVGDTGPAALWGASLAATEDRCLAVNYGNGHTLAALVWDGRLDGLFEHHTALLRPDTMESYLRRFAAGELDGDKVYADGGHGALPVLSSFDLSEVQMVVTGPNRDRFASVGEKRIEAALYGNMMLTGCYGLLEGFLARSA